MEKIDSDNLEQKEESVEDIEQKLKEYIPSSEQKEQLNSILDVLKKSEENDLNVVVMAGYGLDGLFGQLTRDHGDLDMLVEDKDVEGFKDILSGNGWEEDTSEKMKKQGGYEFRHPSLPQSFKIEFGNLSQMKNFMKEGEDIDKYIPRENNAILEGTPFKSFTLEAHRWSTEIQNKRLDGTYPTDKVKNKEMLFKLLEAKEGNQKGKDFLKEKYSTSNSLPTADIEISSIDENAESNFYNNGKQKIEALDPTKSIVLFDYDGTQIANINKENTYTRKAFSELYKRCKEKNILVGTLSMRNLAEINQVKNHPMDLAIGEDSMETFFEKNPITEEQKRLLEEYKKMDRKEIEIRGLNILDTFRDKKVVTGELMSLCYLLKEKSAEGGDHNPSKILFLAKIISKFPDLEIILFDDNQTVANIGEKMGLVVKANLPQGFQSDHEILD